MTLTIPTRPGWWWRKAAFSPVRVAENVRIYGGGWLALGWYNDLNKRWESVTDDGRWVHLVPTPEEITDREAEMERLTAVAACGSLRGMLVAASILVAAGEDSCARELLSACGIRTQEKLAAESARAGLDGVDENRLMKLVEGPNA